MLHGYEAAKLLLCRGLDSNGNALHPSWRHMAASRWTPRPSRG
jgi:hypothetical protein